jgi:hypothetical protein
MCDVLKADPGNGVWGVGKTGVDGVGFALIGFANPPFEKKPSQNAVDKCFVEGLKVHR